MKTEIEELKKSLWFTTESLFPHCMRSQKVYSPFWEGTSQLVLDLGVILQYLIEEIKF